MRMLGILCCVTAAACGGGSLSDTDAGPGDDAGSGIDPLCAEPLAWHAAMPDLDRSALAMWGDADDDMYLVGGSLGAPGGSLLMHYDGKRFTEIPTGHDETLWWVWGAPAGTDVWMVGEHGVALRWDGAAIHEVGSGTAAPLYGVWGSSSDDVYLVGGTPGSDPGPDDVVLHWDGRAVTAIDLPAKKNAALFKVWGASADDVWITGEAGTIWHKTASGWVDESLPGVFATLSTVAGCSADEVYTVGGQHIYRFDGASWAEAPGVQPLGFAAGVSCGTDSVLVVGSGGMKLRLDKQTGVWIDDTLEKPYDTDFHGAWISPGGSMWASGGNYIAPPSQIDHRIGVVARRGCD